MPRFNRSRKRSWCRKQNPSLQGNDGSRKLCAKPQVHYISEEVGYEQIRGHVLQRGADGKCYQWFVADGAIEEQQAITAIKEVQSCQAEATTTK